MLRYGCRAFPAIGKALQTLAAASLLMFSASTAIPQTSAPLAQKSQEAAEITSVAQQDGHVRVIVMFNSPIPPNQLNSDPTSVATARAQVAAAQDGIIASHFGSASSPSQGQGFARGLARFPITPGFVVNVTLTELQALAADARVIRINYDRAVPPSLIESVPLIGMTTAYTLNATGAGQAVAVLDTGVKSNHEFLNGKVAAEACFSNAGGFGGQVTLCPGGGSSQTGAGAANADTAACISGAQNICNHGTHVAGIAAGLNSNQQGGEPSNGVAKDGKIFAIQIFTRFNSAASCSPSPAPCVLSFTSDQVLGLDHVFANINLGGGTVVASANMSLGGGLFSGTCDSASQKPAIDNLRAAGVLTAIASGNNGSTSQISSPGCISTAVAVGSTTKSDQVSSFSNMSSVVDLLAPGSSILSSIPVVPSSNTTTYAFFNGTSMATPHVAGAVAAIRSACPSATATQMEDALKSTGTPITDTRPGGTQTKPRIRVDLALASLGCAADTLSVSPATNISSSGNQGGPFSPSSFQYTLAASSGTLNYSITGLPSWLTASSTSGSVGTGGTTITFTVNASANSLSSGTYNATISFTNTTNGNGNTTRTAALTVNDVSASTLQVSPATNISSSGAVRGPFSPSSFQYQLSASTGTLNYSITGLPSWLTASSTSGSVGTGGTTITFTVNASASLLSPGTYNATISFANTTNGNGNTTRAATLVIAF